MPDTRKTRAFILTAADYRETSTLLQLFCEAEGRVSLIAKGLRGARSKKATLAEPFSLVQATYRLKEGATLGLLATLEGERRYAGIRARLEAYALANYWFEVLAVAVQPRLPSPELFTLTESLLDTLDAPPQGAGGTPRLAAWHFGRLLAALGFEPHFEACESCGATTMLDHLDPAKAAVLCARCAPSDRHAISIAPPGAPSAAPPTNPAAILAQLFGLEPPPPTQPLPRSAWAIFLATFQALLSSHFDQQFRSYAFLRSLVADPALATRASATRPDPA